MQFETVSPATLQENKHMINGSVSVASSVHKKKDRSDSISPEKYAKIKKLKTQILSNSKQKQKYHKNYDIDSGLLSSAKKTESESTNKERNHSKVTESESLQVISEEVTNID